MFQHWLDSKIMVVFIFIILVAKFVANLITDIVMDKHKTNDDHSSESRRVEDRISTTSKFSRFRMWLKDNF